MREKSWRYLIVIVGFTVLAAGWVAGCFQSQQSVPRRDPIYTIKKKHGTEADARLRNEITAAAEKADAVEVFLLGSPGQWCYEDNGWTRSRTTADGFWSRPAFLLLSFPRG